MRIKPRPKNKPAVKAGFVLRPRDIRVYRRGFSRPIACRKRSAPDILHGSYLENPSNLPLHRIIRACLRTRAPIIYQCGEGMSREFLWFSEKIFSIFCQGFTRFPFNPAKEGFQNGNKPALLEHIWAKEGRGKPLPHKILCFPIYYDGSSFSLKHGVIAVSTAKTHGARVR